MRMSNSEHAAQIHGKLQGLRLLPRPPTDTIIEQLLPLQCLSYFTLQLEGISAARLLPSTQLPSFIPTQSTCVLPKRHFSPTRMHTHRVFHWVPFKQVHVDDQIHSSYFVLIPMQKCPTPCLRLSYRKRMKTMRTRTISLDSGVSPPSHPGAQDSSSAHVGLSFTLSTLNPSLPHPSLSVTVISPRPHFFNQELTIFFRL